MPRPLSVQTSPRARLYVDALALAARSGSVGSVIGAESALLDYIASLEADRERLDDLAGIASRAQHGLSLYEQWTPDTPSAIWRGAECLGTGKNFREALDAARSVLPSVDPKPSPDDGQSA